MRRLILLLVLCLASAPHLAQEVNAPVNCPYCGGEAERMAPAGISSHGGFPFGRLDTQAVDALLPNSDIYWIASEHFEIGFAVGPHKVKQKEKKKIRAELERLARVLPDVNPKAKVLDPWLRTHLYAQRFEDVYARMLEILQVTQDKFPSPENPWILGEPYYGEGPYLGQKGKYEALIVPSASQQVAFLREQFGLQVRHTQKWNVVETDSMLVVANLSEDDIHGDQHLHNHMAFNAVHILLDGYKHYSYDTPLYLQEGLAHHLERSITPEYNTFSFSEGGIPDEINKSDWDAAAKKLIAKEDLPRLAELLALDGYGEFEARHHLGCWSITEFFLERYPDEYAALHGRLHGRKNEEGYPDGSGIRDVHREAVRELFGKSYAALDLEWREWALAR